MTAHMLLMPGEKFHAFAREAAPRRRVKFQLGCGERRLIASRLAHVIHRQGFTRLYQSRGGLGQ